MLQSYHQQSPQDLDFLVNELRHPNAATTHNKVLGYLYHYVPYVKIEHNLKVVIASFLNNPLCFGTPVPSFQDNYLIIEVFKLITDKKLRVSRPTLSIKQWYEIVLRELKNFAYYRPIENLWKVLPVIAGLLLSNELRDELYTNVNFVEYKMFFSRWDAEINQLFRECLRYLLVQYQNDNITNLGLLSLAVVYKRNDGLHKYIERTLHHTVVRQLVDLVFGPHQFGVRAIEGHYRGERDVLPPVLKHLNKLSFLLEDGLGLLPLEKKAFGLIEHTLLSIKHLNQHVEALTRGSPFNTPALDAPLWLSLKNLLFSEVVIFQGILTRFLTSRPGFFSRYPLEHEYKQLSIGILYCLYHMNFVLVSIGQGGFDNYNFVYYLTLEILLKNNTHDFERLTQFLVCNHAEVNLHLSALGSDYVMRCKVLFVLGLWENYLQQEQKDERFVVNTVYDVASSLVRSVVDTDTVEAAHSVLLVYFSKLDVNLAHSTEYLHLLLAQFPQVLSATQLSIAVETLGKKHLLTPSAELFLDYVYRPCKGAKSGVPLPHQQTQAFASAQPINEIDAASTLSQLETPDSVVDQNKADKPKDRLAVNIEMGSEPQPTQTKRTTPETTREALASAFFNLLPYVPLLVFDKWVRNAWALVSASSPREHEYLQHVLWGVLSENLDLNRCEMAYRWWYGDVVARL